MPDNLTSLGEQAAYYLALRQILDGGEPNAEWMESIRRNRLTKIVEAYVAAEHDIEQLMMERDEARAEVDRLKADIAEQRIDAPKPSELAWEAARYVLARDPECSPDDLERLAVAIEGGNLDMFVRLYVNAERGCAQFSAEVDTLKADWSKLLDTAITDQGERCIFPDTRFHVRAPSLRGVWKNPHYFMGPSREWAEAEFRRAWIGEESTEKTTNG